MKTPKNLIETLKPLYTEQYDKIHEQHLNKRGGADIVKALSDLADDILLKAFLSIDPALSHEWGGALIAIGGYGRQELSPYSDIDLMFLHQENEAALTDKAASALLCFLWDLGFKVGHSTRTIEETVQLAREDQVIATSLLESRFLYGDRDLFKRFHQRFFSKVVKKDLKAILAHLRTSREKVRAEYGLTPCRLEPNLKLSPGALRDVHLLKWMAVARYRTHDLPQIFQWGHLSHVEYEGLVDAQDFLWRLRNHLHFLSGKATDELTIDLQHEIAPFFDLQDRRGLMRRYYEHTGHLLEITKRFTRDVVPIHRGVLWARSLIKRQVAPGFQVCNDEISVLSSKPLQFFEQDENVLRLFLLAKTHRARISDTVLELIGQISRDKRNQPLSPQAISLFKVLMRDPGGITRMIRLMHRIQLLWRIIPDYEKINHLVQESRSHAFTVDEHSFRVLEATERFMEIEGPSQKIYTQMPKKDVLHLAILLHDVAKSAGRDHSAVGGEVADGIGIALSYAPEDQEMLSFLVRKHLKLSEVALFRDFSNEPVLQQFAAEVQDRVHLDKLFVLTCADIRATAPEAWSSWKKELLTMLYEETVAVLQGNAPDTGDQFLASTKAALVTRWKEKHGESWLKDMLSSLHPRYFQISTPEKIGRDLDALSRLDGLSMLFEAQFLKDRGVTEYTLYTYDWITPGIFSCTAGVLAAKGLQIRSAQVFTHKNSTVIDTFNVFDPDYPEAIDPDRIADIRKDLKQVLTGRISVESLFASSRRYSKKKVDSHAKPSLSVEIDNHSSESFTVVEVTAADYRGLLYQITKTISELGIVIHAAKIATRLDQVVDIFYVLGPNQEKISEVTEIEALKEGLCQGIKKSTLERVE